MNTTISHREAEPTPVPVKLFQCVKHTSLSRAGATIFLQGDAGEAMYVVTAGEVAILRDGVCEAGELVGDPDVPDGTLHSATAVAHTACLLAVIDLCTFQLLLDTTPASATQVLCRLAALLRGQLSSPASNASPLPWRTPTTRLRGVLRYGPMHAATAASISDAEMVAPNPID